MGKLGAFIKGLGSIAVVVAGYVNHNLSPLFWTLLVLAALDIVLNIHHLEKQFAKLGSAFAALGLPVFLSSNDSGLLALDPAVLKVVVAVLTIGYLQVVVPQLLSVLSSFAKKHPAEAPVIQDVEILVAKAVASAMAEAKTAASPNKEGGANG